jgi:serine/threonine-protein kinase RsbW
MSHLLKLKLKSSPCQVAYLQSYVAKLKSECHLPQEVHDNILITLTEAVNNAIIHGNKADTNKHVKIMCVDKTSKVIISISDEGLGFNPNKVTDPTLQENLECCGGRGVYIMKELSDTIEFLDEGRTVQMHFHRQR